MAHLISGHTLKKTLYVNKVPISGWLNVQLKSRLIVPLLKYTKLEMIETTGGRTWFTVMDGGQKGAVASLHEANAKEYLGNKAPLQTGVHVEVKYGKIEQIASQARGITYTQQTASLSVDGIHALITLNTLFFDPRYNKFTALPPGLYKIRVPEHPHNKNMTEFYRQRVQHDMKYDQVWFPIEYGDNSRFIHIGNISEGCITVMSLDKWNDIHEALTRHRVPGTRYLGHVMISH